MPSKVRNVFYTTVDIRSYVVEVLASSKIQRYYLNRCTRSRALRIESVDLFYFALVDGKELNIF